jgi:hypothetical protein
MNEKKGCVVIQSCDKYQKTWKSLFWSMDKYWDFKIPWPIFFCNENVEIKFENKAYSQIKTGDLSHAQMMKSIFSQLKDYEYIFYMLDDFWPTDRMTEDVFIGLFSMFEKNNWDSLKICAHMPAYYKIQKTNHTFNGKSILKFKKDSEWRFNQQASFWKRSVFEDCIVDSDISMAAASSSLPVEIEMDKELKRKYPDAEVYIYPYMWYPVGGALWRGKITLIGEQIEFARKVDELLSSY